jgi:ParB family transcriptional regulator, chromosome partitioning protein
MAARGSGQPDEAAADVVGGDAPARVGAARFAMAGHLFGRRRTVFAAVPIACVKPNPQQPRQYFDPESLQELADSIRSRGLLQPIIVRRGSEGEYTLVAGERRLRAAELAGIGLVPAILSEDDLLEVALEENVQREDLSPLEEAEALAALAQERGHSHAELAQVIHKSRPYVSNTLALTRLPDDVKREYFREGRVVSREILINIARQQSPEAMRALWNRVRLQSISVRSYRREAEVRRPPSPLAVAVRAARRLNRALRVLPEAGDLTAALRDASALRRTLERTQRRIAAVLLVLPPRSANTAAGRRAAPRPLA